MWKSQSMALPSPAKQKIQDPIYINWVPFPRNMNFQQSDKKRKNISWITFISGFPSGSVIRNSPANAGDMDLIPGLERSTGGGNGNPLHCSCLENPKDRETLCVTVHGVTKSWTCESWTRMCAHTHAHTRADTHTHTHTLSLCLFSTTYLSLVGSLPNFPIPLIIFTCDNKY